MPHLTISVFAAVLVWLIATSLSFASWSTSRRSSSTSSLYSTLVGLYVDPPPLADAVQVEHDGKQAQLQNLRAVRVWAKHEEENDKGWAAASAKFGGDSHSPANRSAYLIANSVNDLGSAAFTGGVSLAMIIGVVGDVIVDDWLACRHWVAAYRQREGVYSTADPMIAYHRRYGEWLAMLCVVILERRWSYEPAARLAARVEGGARRRFLALTRVDSALLPLHVRWELFWILPFDMRFQILFPHLLPKWTSR